MLSIFCQKVSYRRHVPVPHISNDFPITCPCIQTVVAQPHGLQAVYKGNNDGNLEDFVQPGVGDLGYTSTIEIPIMHQHGIINYISSWIGVNRFHL